MTAEGFGGLNPNRATLAQRLMPFVLSEVEGPTLHQRTLSGAEA